MSYLAKSVDIKIIELIKNGAVGFMPSDTIYGLSCSALNQTAVKKLHGLKGRDKNKPFIVLISDIKMLDLLSISQTEAEAARIYWPGPLTLICKTSDAPAWLTHADGTVAVRLPADENLRDLISQTGPLISTSANMAGGEPATSVQEAQDYFADSLDFYVDSGKLSGQPSTIARPISGKLKVIRQGVLTLREEDLYEL